MNPRVKVTGSSGLASQWNSARTKAAGFACFIPKPCTAEVTLHTLAQALHGRT